MRPRIRNDTFGFLVALYFLRCGGVYASEGDAPQAGKRWHLFTTEEVTSMWDAGKAQREETEALQQKLRDALPHLKHPTLRDLADDEVVVLEPLLVSGEKLSGVFRFSRQIGRGTTETSGIGVREGAPDWHQRAELDKRAAAKFFDWRPGPADATEIGTVEPLRHVRDILSKGILSIFAPPEE